MSLLRRLRGIAGTALIWGGIGALVGMPVFVAVFRPWRVTRENWSRIAELFVRWEAASLVWGVATGLTFGLVVMALERTRGWSQLSARRLTVWGALAGGLFPALLSIRPLQSGASVWYFGPIIAGSAIMGALWARASFAMARRVPAGASPAALRGGDMAPIATQTAASRDRVS